MTDDDAALLAFEEDWTGTLATKYEAVYQALGLSPARYHQRILELLDDGEAEAAFPQLIHRLRRLEAERADAREKRAESVRDSSR